MLVFNVDPQSGSCCLLLLHIVERGTDSQCSGRALYARLLFMQALIIVLYS